VRNVPLGAPAPECVDLGDLTVTALTDALGSFTSFGDAFPDCSAELESLARSRFAQLFDNESWVLPFRAVLVRARGQTVVVDAGIGSTPSAFLPSAQGWLEGQLADVGVGPADVDTVLLTHLHVDHVGWCARGGAPFFPRARYVSSAADWSFFASRAQSRRLFTEKLAPLRKAGVLELVELRETEVAAGVTLFPTPGHTPGHMSVRLTGAARGAVILGDVAVHPVQLFDPHVAYAYEVDQPLAARTRLALLGELADSDVVVVAGHFPVALGHLTRDHGGFAWRALPAV